MQCTLLSRTLISEKALNKRFRVLICIPCGEQSVLGCSRAGGVERRLGLSDPWPMALRSIRKRLCRGPSGVPTVIKHGTTCHPNEVKPPPSDHQVALRSDLSVVGSTRTKRVQMQYGRSKWIKGHICTTAPTVQSRTHKLFYTIILYAMILQTIYSHSLCYSML